MAVVEDIELRVTVDATGAQKGLDETRKAAESMGGRVGNLTEAFKSLQQKLGPSAAAISGVASALGQTNGEAGKALAAVGQVAAAFAAGGPFGAALAAGTFAVDQLTASWERQIKAQDEAIKAQYAQFDAANKTTKQLEQQAEALRLQLEPLSASEIRSRAKAQMAELDRAIFLNNTEAEYARRHAPEKAKALGDQNLQLERQKALIFEVADLQARALERGAGGRAAAGPAAARGMDPLQARIVAGMAAQEQARAAADEAFEADIDRMAAEGAARLSFEQLKSSILADAEEERTELARKAAEERARIAQDEQKATIDAVTGGLGVVVGAFQGYVDARIKGEEDAEAAFISSIMRQAGQALISYGTQAIGRGILEASSPLTAPLAAASFTAGAGLIAGGIALGGAASGITQAAATATAPQQSTSGGGSDLGARARPARPGMGGGPGGTNLTIVYGGLSGPSADDGARALGRGLERARRRGLAL